MNVAGSVAIYGTGSNNIKEYTMVDARGDVLKISRNSVVRWDSDGNLVSYSFEFFGFSDGNVVISDL